MQMAMCCLYVVLWSSVSIKRAVLKIIKDGVIKEQTGFKRKNTGCDLCELIKGHFLCLLIFQKNFP